MKRFQIANIFLKTQLFSFSKKFIKNRDLYRERFKSKIIKNNYFANKNRKAVKFDKNADSNLHNKSISYKYGDN